MLPRLNSNKLICITALCIASSISVAEDLAYIMNLALETDTTLAQAKQTELATLEVLPQARAGLLPTVSATAGTAFNNTNNPQLLDYNTFNYSGTLSQPVFNVGNWQIYRQADLKIKAAVANYEDAYQDLILRVITQYFKILKAIDDLSFTMAERKAFSRSLDETQQKFDAGVIAITDVNEAQAKFDSSRAQEIAAEYEVYNQKEIMGEITGVPAKNISLLRANIILHAPIPDDIEFWVRNALKQNYSLQSKHFDADSAKKEIAIQRAANYPTVDAVGTTGYSKAAPGLPFLLPEKYNANSVTVTVNLPVFSGGKIFSKTTQAMRQYEITVQQALNVERQITSNIRQSYRGVLTQISQIKALQQSVISSKSALDATTAAFEVGTRTIVDVLNSQTDLLRAMSNLSKARYDYIVASFTLKRFSGVLRLEDVNIINSWLIPAPKGPTTDQNKTST